jgi:PD-(D/E)XK endonuclease
MLFMARAAEHGLVVTKPWGDSAHYDFIVECNGCVLRIQVKSTMSRNRKTYLCTLYSARRCEDDDFDFLAAYVIPLDLWYLVPAEVVVTGKQKLCLSPQYPNSIYEPYREAWHLLKQKRCAGNIRDCDLCFRHGCQARLRGGPVIEQLEPYK